MRAKKTTNYPNHHLAEEHRNGTVYEISADDIYTCLSKFNLFKGLFDSNDNDTTNKIVSFCQPVEFQPGQNIITGNTEASGCYLIISGIAQVEICSQEDNSIEVFMAYRGPSQHVGVNNIVLNEKHLFATRALTRCFTLRISQDDFMSLYKNLEILNRNVFSVYINRLYEEVFYRDKMSRLDVHGGLANLLLRITDLCRPTISFTPDEPLDLYKNGIFHLNWLTHDLISQDLSRKREQITKSLNHFKSIGLIMNTKYINISDENVSRLVEFRDNRIRKQIIPKQQ